MEHENKHTEIKELLRRLIRPLFIREYLARIFFGTLIGIFLIWVTFFAEFSPDSDYADRSYVDPQGRDVFVPGPVRSSVDYDDAIITQDGVIEWVNKRRTDRDLPPLTKKVKLTASAASKVHDIFAQQSLDHISPSGTTVSDLIDRQGYNFPAVGELIAFGNFRNDEELVQAWMDSAGNRSIILNSEYRSFGVAIGKNIFEGKELWVVVQHVAP